jgi:hypothetical protein
MTSPNEPKRLGRTKEAHRLRAELFGSASGRDIRLRLWPDAYELLSQDAIANGLTRSGMGHQIIRNYYRLPPIP